MAASGRRGEATGAAKPDPVLKEVALGDGSSLTVGVASDSLAYCLLVASGEVAVFLDAQPRAAFDRAHVHGAWCLDGASGGGGSSSSSSGGPAAAEAAHDAALRARCSLRSVVVYSSSAQTQGDERINDVLRTLQRVGARPKGQVLVLRGGLEAFSKRFGFCVCGKGGEKAKPLGACPAEVLAPGWGGSKPPALYLGAERCLLPPAGQPSNALGVLRIGAIINLSGKPCPRTNCKVIEVTGAAADDQTLRAREACAKLGRQGAPCMLYGSEQVAALAAALFLVEVLPKAVNSKDAAISLIKQRVPATELDSAAAQVLLARAAGMHVEATEVPNGPGGPRVAGSPAPPPPQAGRTEPPAAAQPPAQLLSVAPSPSGVAAAPSRPPPAAARSSGKGGAAAGRGNGAVAKESSVAAEVFAKLHARDRKGSEIALKTLRAAWQHILDKPSEEKYRCLKGSNARVKSELLAYPEAVQLLRLVGFSQVGEDFVLPEHAPLQVIRDVLAGLERFPLAQATRRAT